MDVLFHGVTGLIISKGTVGNYLLSASFFSVLPDLLGTTTFEYFKFKNSSKDSVKAFINDWKASEKKNKFFTKWDKFAYRTTHTLFFLPLIALFAFMFFKDVWLILLICYLFHLLVDALTHEGEFAFRPFWPFSDWNLQGRSWTNSRVFLTFWIVLIGIFVLQLLIWG